MSDNRRVRRENVTTVREKGACPTVELTQRKVTLCGTRRGMRLSRDTDKSTRTKIEEWRTERQRTRGW